MQITRGFAPAQRGSAQLVDLPLEDVQDFFEVKHNLQQILKNYAQSKGEIHVDLQD